MALKDQKADLEWRDGDVPVSVRFDDPYFSATGGLAESRHVFLAGNHLPQRFRPGFHIGELGFGTGLNMLAAWAAWRDNGRGGTLRFTSFEAFPMAPEDMTRALARFPEIDDLASGFLKCRAAGETRIRLDGLDAEIVTGDARDTLPRMADRVDAWFLDGFSPARNPELWGRELMAEVAAHTHSGGTFATYTAAGHIRRTLNDVGFSTDRRPGFGRKRHMTCGFLKTT